MFDKHVTYTNAWYYHKVINVYLNLLLYLYECAINMIYLLFFPNNVNIKLRIKNFWKSNKQVARRVVFVIKTDTGEIFDNVLNFSNPQMETT